MGLVIQIKFRNNFMVGLAIRVNVIDLTQILKHPYRQQTKHNTQYLQFAKGQLN